ncbi:S-adenosylmethionine sensor upstream of mTORC1, partial [Tachysurus ichikawai]
MEIQSSVRTEPEPKPGVFYPVGPKDALCERDEQEKLSGVVKRVHRTLRRKYIE